MLTSVIWQQNSTYFECNNEVDRVFKNSLKKFEILFESVRKFSWMHNKTQYVCTLMLDVDSPLRNMAQNIQCWNVGVRF